jgi:Membrane proteins related to metalloendopeptidases
MHETPFENIIRKNQPGFHRVVDFDAGKEKLLAMDFTENNPALTVQVLNDTEAFSEYISDELKKTGARYGIGGYAEHRTIYNRSPVFDSQRPGEEPRRLHLGVDIWGPAGTKVYAFMGGMVHSLSFNDQYGDYGATIILLHQLEGMSFYTLYGHLSLRDIDKLSSGQYITIGETIGHFGLPPENGHWPPHLHFQVILDMQLREGDYPGVCKFSEREQYLANSPDPDLILQLNRYL